MKEIIATLLNCSDNPHVFRPIVVALILRFGLWLFLIFCPSKQAQIHQLKDHLDPLITALICYGMAAAAKSGPAPAQGGATTNCECQSEKPQ